LPALFLDCCANYPLLAWTRRRAENKPIVWSVDGWYILGLLAVVLIWSYPNLKVDNDELVSMVWVTLAFYLIFFASQVLVAKHLPNHFLLLKLIGPLSAWAMNYYRDGKNGETKYGFLAMINYDFMFMA